MESDNVAVQNEELESLKSIFEKEFTVEAERCTDGTICCSYCFSYETDELNVIDGRLDIRLPMDYPSESPPCFELTCPKITATEKHKLSNMLQEIYLNNINMPVLFLWIDAVRNELSNKLFAVDQNDEVEDAEEIEVACCVNQLRQKYTGDDLGENVTIPEVISGGQLTDRKSTFQAHLVCPITEKVQTKAVLNKLLENTKIARATHNIYAYRLQLNETALVIQDCEDDGEHHAGERLLHLLIKMNVINAMVVVTRWYGGIHLGNDRFKHINSVAKDLLEAHGFGHGKTGDVKQTGEKDKDLTTKQQKQKQKTKHR